MEPESYESAGHDLNNPSISESLPEIFYPGVPDLRDSGVFMIRESKRMNSGTFACIKLPVNVSFMDEKFVGIVDDDAAAAKQPNVAKRQVTVLKVSQSALSEYRVMHVHVFMMYFPGVGDPFKPNEDPVKRLALSAPYLDPLAETVQPLSLQGHFGSVHFQDQRRHLS